jgi:hypothetical protein
MACQVPPLQRCHVRVSRTRKRSKEAAACSDGSYFSVRHPSNSRTDARFDDRPNPRSNHPYWSLSSDTGMQKQRRTSEAASPCRLWVDHPSFFWLFLWIRRPRPALHCTARHRWTEHALSFRLQLLRSSVDMEWWRSRRHKQMHYVHVYTSRRQTLYCCLDRRLVLALFFWKHGLLEFEFESVGWRAAKYFERTQVWFSCPRREQI